MNDQGTCAFQSELWVTRYFWGLGEKMNTQKEVTTNMRTKSGELLRIKKCSQPSLEVKNIYDALALQYQPYRMKKSVVPEKTQKYRQPKDTQKLMI